VPCFDRLRQSMSSLPPSPILMGEGRGEGSQTSPLYSSPSIFLSIPLSPFPIPHSLSLFGGGGGGVGGVLHPPTPNPRQPHQPHQPLCFIQNAKPTPPTHPQTNSPLHHQHRRLNPRPQHHRLQTLHDHPRTLLRTHHRHPRLPKPQNRIPPRHPRNRHPRPHPPPPHHRQPNQIKPNPTPRKPPPIPLD